MLDSTTVRALAARLHDAERTRQQIRQISLEHPDITIADAYAIQRAWMDIKLGEGRVKRGHKIGLTSRAMQLSSQIDEPDFGMLLDDMFFEDGGDIPASRFILPRLEVELAFVLGKRLQGPNVTLFQVYDAVEYVIPALEIIDARSHGIDPDSKRPRKVFDTIADNAA
ncbi:MAG: 2-oxo-hepta-3-ene-1,7-dioic acid hydratase, partial [Achromobacter sp.]|nr:2-oxo-hepta-3-ene-1,7-dioic acid hydratase [Achromobacter sp.]